MAAAAASLSSGWSGASASRATSRTSNLLKPLRTQGLIKKVGRTYKYYLTKLGRSVIVTILNIRETIVMPGLSTKFL